MLEVRDIWKSYEGKPLLSGVSLQVAKGETVCLLGASGSGKSTLLRIITGLEAQERGQILWEDQDLTGVPVHQRNFGLMFQDYALFPHRSVAENVAFGLRMHGQPRDAASARVKEVLERVHMADFANRRVTDLSGGEQQRVALARTLAPNPRLLMFDEPLGALDRALKDQVEQDLRRVLHETDIPAIYVTHDQEEAFAVADRLVLLNQGRVIQSGSPAEVYESPATPWVAQFLGLNNLIPARVVATDPPQAETPEGRFCGIWGASEPVQVGQPVTLLLRPDVVQPQTVNERSGDQRTNDLQGVVVDSVFHGNGFRLSLRSRSGQVFSFLARDHYAAGQPVRLTVDASAVQFLREEE